MVFKSILNHFGYENEGWCEIKNVLKPPIYCIQSYERKFGETTEIKTEALFCFKTSFVSDFIRNPQVFLSAFPDVIPVSCRNEQFYYKTTQLPQGKRSLVSCSSSFIKEEKRVNRILYGFNSNFINFYLFSCQDFQQGCKFTVQLSLNNNHIDDCLFYYCLQCERKFIYNLGELLRNDVEGNQSVDIENEYFRRLEELVIYTKVIHKSERISVLCDEGMSEIVFVGESTHGFDINKYAENVFSYTGNHPLFSRTETIQKSGRAVIEHHETCLFDKTPCESDVIYVSKIVEGSVFAGCRTINCECPFEHKNGEGFSIVLAAESVRLHSDGKLRSIFYLHYTCPFLKTMERKEQFARIKCIFNAVLMDRIGIENGINFVPTKNNGSVFDLTKIYLSNALHYQSIFLQKKRKSLTSVGQCPQKGAFDFSGIDRKLILHIFSYLPLEDLVCCMGTCKRFERILRYNQEIWKNFYDLYFNPITFNKYDTIDDQITQPRKEYCYYEIVSHSKNIKKKWGSYCPIVKKRVEVFQHLPVSYIFPFVGNETYYVGSSEGRMKKISYQTHHYYNEYVFTEKVVAMDINQQTNEIIFGMGDGTVRTYCNESDQYDNLLSTPYNKMKFVHRDGLLLAWNNRKIGVYDIDKYLLIDDFSCHSAPITHVDEIRQNLVLSSSEDQTLLAFDFRSNTYTFQSEKIGSTISTFDSFDDYIVLGTYEGSISMYDIRMNKFILNRRINNSPMTMLKCHNRKIIFSQYDKIVSYYDCDKGSFRNLHILYQHQQPITSIECNNSMLMTGSKDGVLYYSQFN